MLSFFSFYHAKFLPLQIFIFPIFTLYILLVKYGIWNMAVNLKINLGYNAWHQHREKYNEKHNKKNNERHNEKHKENHNKEGTFYK